MMMDPNDNNAMYITGAFNSIGGILKTQRSNCMVNFLVSFPLIPNVGTVASSGLDSITSYSFTDSGHLYGCGSLAYGYSGGVFQIQTDGTPKWFKNIVNYMDSLGGS
jgi:hypothetical protein